MSNFYNTQAYRRKSAMSKGEKAEHWFCSQFNGKRFSDKETQLKDIDVATKGYTWSIKDQIKSSAKTGNISLEVELVNTRTGKSIAGCFQTSQADCYGWAITYMGKPMWLRMRRSTLYNWALTNKSTLCKVSNTDWVVEDNRKQGRTYDDARSLLVPIQRLVDELEEGIDYSLTDLIKCEVK